MVAVPLGQPGGFPGTIPKIVEFGTLGLAATDGLYVNYVGRIDREYPLHALVADETADRKGLIDTAAPASDHRAGKDLYAGLGTFGDLAVHIDRIAYFEIRNLFLKALSLN